MKKTLLFASFIMAFVIASAQKQNFELKKCIDISANRIVNDNLGNVYLLEKSSLMKYDVDGNFLFSYTELGDGLITSVDVSDPLKIVLFNSDFGKIKFLDNKLSIKNDPISLSDLGYNNATLVAASYESGFWIFDPLSNQLVRFDKNLQLSQQSGSISDLIGHEFKPDFLVEYDNSLYANDPQYGIFVFDRYGTFLKDIPVKNIKSFEIFSNQILYVDKNVLKSLDLKTYDEKKLSLPVIDDEIISLTIDAHNMSLLTKTKFCIYKNL
jgi:hypothetical protein